jgi:DNA mismatch repair protein MutL
MPIRLLPPDVADKIAAGEVIERPVSVAKELLENAIDSGADAIQVLVAQGGRRLVQVVDNGCGIPAAEVPLAFSRHATSKLASAEELYTVRTLGFRGEALASIGAVSRLSLATRARGEELGTLIRMEGGLLGQPEAQGRPFGTSVEVENLFFNTPARLKFLRADTTESGHIARLASSYALAYPEVRFTLHNNGREVLRTTGTGSLYDVLVDVYGLDVAEGMLPIEATSSEGGALRVHGFVSAPDVHRSNRSDILFFINRRWVQDNSLTYAAAQAYQTLLPQRRYPLVVLNIDMPPEDVDVNIHPTKREVRFRHSREVFAMVQRAVRATLLSQRPLPVQPLDEEAWERRQALRTLGQQTWQNGQRALDLYRTADQLTSGGTLAPRNEPATPVERLPMLRPIGQIAQTYVLAEGPGGLYIIDQHAAHERIRYEELGALAANGAHGQQLLEPLPLDLSPELATLLEGHLEALRPFGFDVQHFGGNTFLVRQVPANLREGDVSAALSEIVEAMLGGGEGASWEEQARITLSCHTAVRAGQTLSLDEMRDLVRHLERAAIPHTCPHGRPIMIHLSQEELERQFLRS